MHSQSTFYFTRKTTHSNQHSSQSEPLKQKSDHFIPLHSLHHLTLATKVPGRTWVQSRQPPSSTPPGPLHWPYSADGLLWLPAFKCHLFSDNCNPPWVLAAAPFLLSTKHFTFQHYTRLTFVSPVSITTPRLVSFIDSNPASGTKGLKYLLN